MPALREEAECGHIKPKTTQRDRIGPRNRQRASADAPLFSLPYLPRCPKQKSISMFPRGGGLTMFEAYPFKALAVYEGGFLSEN